MEKRWISKMIPFSLFRSDETPIGWLDTAFGVLIERVNPYLETGS
jgi:hypothetical protein